MSNCKKIKEAKELLNKIFKIKIIFNDFVIGTVVEDDGSISFEVIDNESGNMKVPLELVPVLSQKLMEMFNKFVGKHRLEEEDIYG